jgi:CIC family chloride channel protein
MGAMLGSAYGAVAHQLLPGIAAAAGAYGLVGMGAVFAATARAPITGLMIIFELTGNYRIILPLMCAIVVATALSNHITQDTIYTLKLRRRGIDIDAPSPSRMAQITIAEAMGKTPRPLTPDQPLQEIVARFAAERTDSLPVTDAVGSLTGIIAASDLERAISHGTDSTATGTTLARDVPRLRASDSLEDAIQALASTDDEGLPVIHEDNQLIGWITHRHVLRAYLKRFGALEASAREPVPPPVSATATTGPPTPANGPRR